MRCPHRERRGGLRAQHVLQRVLGAQAEQRAVPRRRLEPDQPRRHDLHRRCAAAERELVEHRADRRRSDRVRARARRARSSAATRSADWSTSRARVRRSQGWHGAVSAPFGNFSAVDVARLGVRARSWPTSSARGLLAGLRRRATATPTNDVTGNDLDSRSALFSKTQLLWTPASSWEARVILTTERARDGDYALNDLEPLRANPFHAARDYEGLHAPRHRRADLRAAPAGTSIDLSATTGFVSWETRTRPIWTTRRCRWRPATTTSRTCSSRRKCAWRRRRTRRLALTDTRDAQVAGRVVALHAGLRQDARQQLLAVRAVAVRRLPREPAVATGGARRSRIRRLRRGTFGFGTKFDVSVGLRGDFEHKEANLLTLLHAGDCAADGRDRRRRTSTTCRRSSRAAYYALVRSARSTRPRRAASRRAGSTPASPPGSEAYGEEHTWNYEGGVKTLWFDRRMSVNATVFHLDWNDMQVNLPNPFVPGQFYIANAAGATSTGVELELNARLAAGLRFLRAASATPTRRFGDGSVSGGVPVAGNRLSNTPNYTADFGGQYTVALTLERERLRPGRDRLPGGIYYDDANTRAAGRLLAVELPRGRARAAAVRRGVAAERLRHAVHPARVRLSGSGAVRVPGRDRRAADVRRPGGRHLLSGGHEEIRPRRHEEERVFL